MTSTAEHGPGGGTDNSLAYGRAFAHFYDRIFPKDPYAALSAQVLAGWHPGGGALEFGVGTGRIAIPLAALTGPVMRGDAVTVSRHLDALEHVDGGIADGYRALALRTADRCGAGRDVTDLLAPDLTEQLR